jgi:hypothetical protein
MKNNKGLSKILEGITPAMREYHHLIKNENYDKEKFVNEMLNRIKLAIKQAFEEARIDRDKVIQEKLIEFAEIMGIDKDKYFDREKCKMENIIENSKYSMGISILSRLVGVLDGLIKDQEQSQEEWLKN